MPFLFRRRRWRHARALRGPLSVLLLLAGLTGCVTLQDDPAPPPFHTGPLQLAAGESLTREPLVQVPDRTRYASVASRAAFYGLMQKPENRRDTAPFGEFTLAPRLALADVVRQLFREESGAAGVLPGRWQERGTLRLFIEIREVIVFAKDVRNTRCEPLVMLRASVVDAQNRRQWSSGLLNNRPDDLINHDCQRLENDPVYAAQAITTATRQAMLELVARMMP